MLQLYVIHCHQPDIYAMSFNPPGNPGPCPNPTFENCCWVSCKALLGKQRRTNNRQYVNMNSNMIRASVAWIVVVVCLLSCCWLFHFKTSPGLFKQSLGASSNCLFSFARVSSHILYDFGFGGPTAKQTTLPPITVDVQYVAMT